MQELEFCCRWDVENCSKEKKASWPSQMTLQVAPHVFATMSWIVLPYRGDRGWGQVKGHLQGLVLIETIESTSWSAALFSGIELYTTIRAGGCAFAHVGRTGQNQYSSWAQMQRWYSVRSKGVEVCMTRKVDVYMYVLKVTMQHTPPFGVGACLPHSKTRNVTFRFNCKQQSKYKSNASL